MSNQMIEFNRSDRPGKVGQLEVINETQFRIVGLTDDIYTVIEDADLPNFVDITSGNRAYLGIRFEDGYLFTFMGVDREHSDPRIAFAQVMWSV
jgi:hypothetical protein